MEGFDKVFGSFPEHLRTIAVWRMRELSDLIQNIILISLPEMNEGLTMMWKWDRNDIFKETNTLSNIFSPFDTIVFSSTCPSRYIQLGASCSGCVCWIQN